ncbi:unnamed protein product [Acanthoscelides obtectus]|uniref:Tetrahydrofolate synthase n=1 Tax=Acanthoscelides obtectus TaxID=200917 RepID=A0A9P0KJV8_ACAOB|nr:unnamed protein product [Acanthoscelides obtectus]CAK1667543.1 Folylpolyglutamate synthase, mitochondrial [Acanthoscelides obtectus]
MLIRFFLLKIVRNFSGMSKNVIPHSEVPDYEAAINALNNLQSNAHYIQNAGKGQVPDKIAQMIKFLNRAGLTLEDLDKLSVIHVTGTNGKGSTCAYSESILRHHGYKTGFFSSPHCIDVRERIRINGIPIPKPQFAKQFWNIYDKLNAQKCDLHLVDKYHNGIQDVTNFPAEIQKKNANLALAVCEAFIKRDPNGNSKSFSLELVKKAIELTKWPGRYQIINHKNSR